MHNNIIDYIENKGEKVFKQTEIGLIPENWEIVKIEETCTFQNGYAFYKEGYSDSGKLVIDLYNISQEGKLRFSDKDKFVSKEIYNKFTKYHLNRNDLVIVMTDMSLELKILGRTAIIDKDDAYILNQRIGRLRVNEKFMDLYYLNYVTNSSVFLSQLYNKVKGTTQLYVNTGDIKNALIPLPPLLEQEKISRVLSKIQQAIEQQDKIIEATKNLKKSLIQKLFTKGIINGFMFDTNIFNHILDNKILIENFPENLNLFITHIQLDELEKTRDQNRRKMLLTIFKKIDQENIPTESLVLSVSKLGKAKLGDENGLYKKIKLDLDEKEIKQNNKQDALIAKTTIKNGLILVTDDSDLLEVTQKYNGEVITLKDFLSGNYRKLKETEIGQIPEGWDVIRLGYIAEFKNGINFTKDQKGKKGILTIAVLNMYGNGIYVKLNNLYRVDKEIDSDYMLNGGDILFVRSSLKREGVGWTSLYKEIHEQVTFCGFIIRARLKHEGVSPEYLTNYLRTDIARNSLISSSGKVSITNINQGMLGRTPVPLPSLPEQQKIAHILSIMDQKIEVEERIKTILKELFKTMLHKLMTGEIRLKDIEV